MQLKELMEDFNLEEILFREEQLKRIELVFYHYKTYGTASNIALTGVTGAGKTFCLEKIMRDHPGEFIYISASMKKRSNQILSLISGQDVRKTDVLLEDTIEKLKKEKKILIIDELNKLQDAKNLFDDLNTIYRETSHPIILVTNNPFLFNKMPEDARLTLFFEMEQFKPYDALQLREICQQRVSLLAHELIEGMEDSTIQVVCAHAAKSGSARKALSLLRRCILNKKFSKEDIEYFVKKEEYEKLESFVNSMNAKERKFLEGLVDIYAKKISIQIQSGNEPIEPISINPKDIHERLAEFSISRISQLITTFENAYGFITTEYSQHGRGGGRYRKIDFINQETYQQLEAVL